MSGNQLHPQWRLADRVGVVTGGANGIGRAITSQFLEAGCRVAVVDKDQRALDSLTKSDSADRILTLAADATLAESAETAVRRVTDTWGGLDILVNNVGGRIGGGGLDAELSGWEATMSLSLTSHFLWCRAGARAMIARGGGRIINMASNAGRYRSNTGSSGISYSAAKGGVLQLTRSVAHELGRFGITVNAIAPGSVLTEAGVQEERELERAVHERVMRETALGYFAPPKEIASIALFLASDDSSYVTGTTILASGGWCAS